MRKTATIHIGKHHLSTLKKISDKTKVPARYIVENALESYLQKEYSDHFDILQTLISDEKKESDKIIKAS